MFSMPWKRWCAVIALVSAGLQAAIAATGVAARPPPATDSQALPASRNRDFGILYAPSAADNPTFREEVSLHAYRPCDYFDARAATPTVDLMLQYEAVLTWVDQAYADNETFGDRLADYVDAGGRAILGQWTYPTTQPYFLAGRIMVPGYCPVIATAYESGSFATSGGCMTAGVLYSDYRDLLDLLPGAAPCYWDDGEIAVAMRRDAGVFYCSGHTGGAAGSGAWGALTSDLAIMIYDFFPATCCDPATGACFEEWGSNCLWPLEWGEAEYCYELDPPCGHPGACCDEVTGSCANGVLALHCLRRHAPGQSCGEVEWQPPCGAHYLCAHSVTMWDDYGDGWNNGYIDIYVEGDKHLSQVTLASGPGPQTIAFAAGTGDEITTTWHPGGWPQEASYCVYDGTGAVLGCDGLRGTEPVGISVDGFCLGPVQGDLDIDGDCDLDDYALFAECLAGPGQPNPGCYPAVFDRADIDDDADVDLSDVGLFQLLFNGPLP